MYVQQTRAKMPSGSNVTAIRQIYIVTEKDLCRTGES